MVWRTGIKENRVKAMSVCIDPTRDWASLVMGVVAGQALWSLGRNVFVRTQTRTTHDIAREVHSRTLVPLVWTTDENGDDKLTLQNGCEIGIPARQARLTKRNFDEIVDRIVKVVEEQHNSEDYDD